VCVCVCVGVCVCVCVCARVSESVIVGLNRAETKGGFTRLKRPLQFKGDSATQFVVSLPQHPSGMV
jgi:hypothetical protein